jgi:hypothetical protein
MRSTLALLGGFSVSTLGVALTLGTGYDLAGVLLILAGGLVAALVPRVRAGLTAAPLRAAAGWADAPSERSLGARLARSSAARRRAG